MAHFIPAECDLTQRPYSEQIVFEQIRSSVSNAWTVFHSFDYVTRNRENKRFDGEIDFLFYHPKYGLLVLEVKGGMIQYKDGEWYQDGHVIDPVVQAKKNKYAVMKLLQDTLERPIPVTFAHAVCFPTCNGTHWPPEAEGIVITQKELPFIESRLKEILEGTQRPINLKGSIFPDEIIYALAPFFEYGARLSDVFDVQESQIFNLTENQCALLKAFSRFNKLQIKGCAGSGKTVMALKKAIQFSQENKKVLLICYNQLLANKLRKQLHAYENITVTAFYDYCIKLLRIPQEQVEQHRTNPQLWEKLPELVCEHFSKMDIDFDALLVDEGQDFNENAWKTILRLADLTDYFYIFYDPDQNIYQNACYIPPFPYPPIELNENCRNTKQIVEELHKCHIESSFNVNDKLPYGVPVKHLYATNAHEMRQLLADELQRLVITEKVKPSDIVILGAHTLKNSSIANDNMIGNFKIMEHFSTQNNEIAYFTYLKFKGCEARVVIVIDFDSNDPAWRGPKGAYTTFSRAIHSLTIISK